MVEIQKEGKMKKGRQRNDGGHHPAAPVPVDDRSPG